MKIEHCQDYESMSSMAADIIYGALLRKPDLLLCTASGNSPAGTYKNLVKMYKDSPALFDKLRIIKLDEWGGIAMNNPQSCESFLQDRLIRPLGIDPSRFVSLASDPADPEKECMRIQDWLKENGPIDLCALGLGRNGHIAFNEPADHLLPNCHITVLSEQSLKHSMATGMKQVPSYGLTLGMANILQSGKIIMLITGAGKKEMIRDFLSGKINTLLPASFLWLHPKVICLIDKFL